MVLERLFCIGLSLVLAHSANAGDIDRNDHCGLVPWLRFDGQGNTSAVGLTTFATPSRIVWAVFDGSGVRRATGTLQSNQLFTPFVAVGNLPNTLSGVALFGLFCLDTNGDNLITSQDLPQLAVSAFYVEPTANDVIYVPTAPLNASNLSQPNPASWTQEPIGNLPGGADIPNRVFYGRYLIGGGNRTRFYLWTAGNAAGQPEIAAYNDGQANPLFLTGRVTLQNHLSVIDIGALDFAGNNAVSGLIAMTLPRSATRAFGFTVISSPTFGAQQTLMLIVRNPVN